MTVLQEVTTSLRYPPREGRQEVRMRNERFVRTVAWIAVGAMAMTVAATLIGIFT